MAGTFNEFQQREKNNFEYAQKYFAYTVLSLYTITVGQARRSKDCVTNPSDGCWIIRELEWILFI